MEFCFTEGTLVPECDGRHSSAGPRCAFAGLWVGKDFPMRTFVVVAILASMALSGGGGDIADVARGGRPGRLCRRRACAPERGRRRDQRSDRQREAVVAIPAEGDRRRRGRRSGVESRSKIPDRSFYRCVAAPCRSRDRSGFRGRRLGDGGRRFRARRRCARASDLRPRPGAWRVADRRHRIRSAGRTKPHATRHDCEVIAAEEGNSKSRMRHRAS